MEIYLDNSATTKVCPRAVNAMMSSLTENYGNPSAVHSKGVAARKTLDTARTQVANVLSASPDEILFSHSGTLANNTAIFGAVKLNRRYGNRVVTTSLEHPSVARCMDALEEQGFEVIRLAPGENGSFKPEDLLSAVNKNTILVSTMLVNNETGAINPVELISKAVRRADSHAIVHVDAIQGFGKLPVKPGKMGIDMLTASGHKIHGPKGVGALYVRKGLRLPPYVLGGGQENNIFSGTEPLPAVVGFGAACASLPNIQAELEEITVLRNRVCEALTQNSAVVINSPKNALPYIINMSVRGIPSQVLINFLSERGIYVSAGSACKRGHRSEVLTKMGIAPEIIDSAIRVSMSRYTTFEEMQIFVTAVNEATRNIRTKL